MTILTEGRRAGEFIISESPGTLSREIGTLALGQDLEAGTVLGRITKGVAAAAAVAGNTGNATITEAPTVGAGAKPGVYRLTALSATRFMVQDPDGIALPNAVAGTEYTTHLTFTITAGATPMVAGDSFTITVAAGSGKLTQFNQDGTDGSEIAAGILIDNVDATSADQPCVFLAREAEINGAELTWPSDIETSEKTAAIAQLAAPGLIVR